MSGLPLPPDDRGLPPEHPLYLPMRRIRKLLHEAKVGLEHLEATERQGVMNMIHNCELLDLENRLRWMMHDQAKGRRSSR